MFPRVSFRVRVVLLMLVIMLLVIGVAGFAINYVSRRAVIAESERSLQELAATSATRIGGLFLQIAAFPQTLSALAETLDDSADARLAWYNATIPAMFAAAPPEVLSLTTFFEPHFIQGQSHAKVWYVRDPTGKIKRVITNMPGEPDYDPDQPIYNYFAQEWYTMPIAVQGLVWSEPYFDAGGANVNMVTASIPVWHKGQLAGVATADVKLDTIAAFVEQIKPTPASYAILVSHRGAFIAHPRRPELVLAATISDVAASLQSSELAEIGAAIHDGLSGLRYLRDPFTGVDVIMTYHHIDQTDWSLAVFTPVADLVRPVEQLSASLLGIGALAIASVALTGWLGATSVLRPITLLVRGVERFAADRTILQLGIKQHDELGRLAAAFEQMATQIARSYTDLEQQVAARTADLRQALAERDQQTRELALALEHVQRKDQEILALSVPVVPLLHDTLVLPIVGVLHSDRAQQMLVALLRRVESQRARVVIIDLTGLAVIDEEIAQIILNAARTVRLLGAEIILVGLRPEVAQTVVALGVDLDGLRTLADLQAAVLDALKRTGRLPQPRNGR